MAIIFPRNIILLSTLAMKQPVTSSVAAVVPVHSAPRFFFSGKLTLSIVHRNLIMEKSPRKPERFCISSLKGGVELKTCMPTYSYENPVYQKSHRILVATLLLSTTSLADTTMNLQRRDVMFSIIGILIGNLWSGQEDKVAIASEFADMPTLRGKDYGKTKMRYPDYSETESGLQYKDLRVGSGPSPKMGETVVIDWDGYTIGYLGRIFEARNKAKGGPFEGGDKEYFKFKLGAQQVIPAFEESVAGMALGGIRRIIVPPELGYPDNDLNKLGPRPMTFSGQRHLDFVLKNEGLIDKTLLFDIELIKILHN